MILAAYLGEGEGEEGGGRRGGGREREEEKRGR